MENLLDIPQTRGIMQHKVSLEGLVSQILAGGSLWGRFAIGAFATLTVRNLRISWHPQLNIWASCECW